MDHPNLYFFPFQLAGAAVLGAFFAMERRLAGSEYDWRVLSSAGIGACVAGFCMYAVTAAMPFDFMVVMGVIAFAAAYLLRDPLSDAMRGLTGKRPLRLDFMTLASTLWAGAACGLGDIRGCIFVVLAMTIISICWPQGKAAVQPEAASITAPVENSPMDVTQAGYLLARAPDPGAVLGRRNDLQARGMLRQPSPSLPEERREAERDGHVYMPPVENRSGSALETALELTALAKAIRFANCGHQAVADMFDSALAKLEPAERPEQLAPVQRPRRLQYCHLTPHPWRAQGLPAERRTAPKPLQRENHRVR